MPAKGYWIATVDVTEPVGYKAYMDANAVAFQKYGATFLVRGGAVETMEGGFRGRTVILEFKDYETALACYNSPEYQAAKALRLGKADADLIVAEGTMG